MAQFRDRDENLYSQMTETGDMESMASALNRGIENPGVVSGTVGEIPKPGEVLKINGLDWKVVRTGVEGRRISLELI